MSALVNRLIAIMLYEPIPKRAIEAAEELLPFIPEQEQSECLANVMDREIVLEWWSEHRKITVYAGEDGYTALKVWGLDMDDEMEYMRIFPSQLPELFAWLRGDLAK